jgi:ubiquinone/menaquinone biosynthesis C-methylase UbiE
LGISVEKKKDTMRFYDATASSYEELYGEEQHTKYDAALKAIKTVQLGKVLDVGCGPAIFLRRIVSTSTIKVGVDISHRMLTNVRAKDRPSIHLICADADFLPLRDGIFDSAFAFTLLQNMPNPTSTLLEMLRVVRTEGLIVVTLPSSEVGREAVRWLEEAGISYEDVEVAFSSKDRVYTFRKARGLISRDEPNDFNSGL